MLSRDYAPLAFPLIYVILYIMHTWDYKVKPGWKPRTEREWLWYLERKINYDDWGGLRPEHIKKRLDRLHIDEGKLLMLKAYFKYYAFK